MTDYGNNCSSFVICMYACQITRMLCDYQYHLLLLLLLIFLFLPDYVIILLHYMHVRIQDYMHAI